MNDMREVFAEQYSLPCVSVENHRRTHPDSIIRMCEAIGAVRRDDGIEFCVELRHDVGPELWTEESLRRSCGKEVSTMTPTDPATAAAERLQQSGYLQRQGFAGLEGEEPQEQFPLAQSATIIAETYAPTLQRLADVELLLGRAASAINEHHPLGAQIRVYLDMPGSEAAKAVVADLRAALEIECGK